MDANTNLEKLRVELAKGNDCLYSLSAADARQILGKINSLESALTELLRSFYAKQPDRSQRELAV